jgi:preprotein translocase subunit SecA
VVLSVLDRKWREHLYEMDYLREGIGLRGWAQRDPLIEYQREGFDMFNTMMDGIKEESVGSLFNLQVQVQQDPIVAEGDDAPNAILTATPPPPGLAPPARTPAEPGQGQRGQGAGGGQRRPARGRGAAPQDAPADDLAGVAPGLARPKRPTQLSYTAPSEDASGEAEKHTASATDADYSKVGRYAPCPCGSGRKFKQCHGDPRNRS